MIKLIYIMGKSSTGKDTIKTELFRRLKIENFSIRELILYTTREKRVNELEGVDYYFVKEDEYQSMLNKGEIVESRTYNKVQGMVRYFTVLDKKIMEPCLDYVVSIGTLESYNNIRNYIAENRDINIKILPVYLEVENKKRYDRAMKREEKEPLESRNYDEVNRRYQADEADFSEEKLRELDINIRFENDNIENTINSIFRYVTND